jgi:hypothetical protein
MPKFYTQRPKKRSDVDLVHVIWDDDQGIVSLKYNEVLFYCWSQHDGGSSNIPTVSLDDRDFALTLGEETTEYGQIWQEATWDDVVALLNHEKFPLMTRIRLSTRRRT